MSVLLATGITSGVHWLHMHPREEKNLGVGKVIGKRKVVSAPPGRARVHFLGNCGDLDGGSGYLVI